MLARIMKFIELHIEFSLEVFRHFNLSHKGMAFETFFMRFYLPQKGSFLRHFESRCFAPTSIDLFVAALD